MLRIYAESRLFNPIKRYNFFSEFTKDVCKIQIMFANTRIKCLSVCFRLNLSQSFLFDITGSISASFKKSS